ncbi:MAG: ABC transporter substrate-binding protein [Alphaproteobacteria bacterium]|nr:ABC transporter substrate-binding protein [Alphaproteobacteria bacterium]
MKHFLCAFLVCLGLVGCKEDKSKNATSAQPSKETLVIATSADYPPFASYRDGQIVGFEIDLMKAVAKRINKEIVIKDMPFDSLIAALQTSNIELAISGFSDTSERREKVDFTAPYHKSSTVLLVPNSSDIKAHDQLEGKLVGVQSGSTYEVLVQKKWKPTVPNLSVRSLSKVPELVQDLKSGRLAAIAIGKKEGADIAKAHPEFAVVDVPGTDIPYAIALPKGSALTDSVNKALQSMKDDGTLQKIEKEWNM